MCAPPGRHAVECTYLSPARQRVWVLIWALQQPRAYLNVVLSRSHFKMSKRYFHVGNATALGSDLGCSLRGIKSRRVINSHKITNRPPEHLLDDKTSCGKVLQPDRGYREESLGQVVHLVIETLSSAQKPHGGASRCAEVHAFPELATATYTIANCMATLQHTMWPSRWRVMASFWIRSAQYHI